MLQNQILQLKQESIIERLDNPEVSRQEIEYLFDLLIKNLRGDSLNG